MHSIAERYDQHRYRQPSPCPLGLSEIARNGNVAPMSDSSVLSLLRERAGLQPDDAAFTYIDYEQDWAGITETLTWSPRAIHSLLAANFNVGRDVAD